MHFRLITSQKCFESMNNSTQFTNISAIISYEFKCTLVENKSSNQFYFASLFSFSLVFLWIILSATCKVALIFFPCYSSLSWKVTYVFTVDTPLRFLYENILFEKEIAVLNICWQDSEYNSRLPFKSEFVLWCSHIFHGKTNTFKEAFFNVV